MKKSLQEISSYYFERFGYSTERLQTPFDSGTKMIIVIPTHNEISVTTTLESLSACDTPESPVEIILVINNSKSADKSILDQNNKSIEEIKTWNKDNTNEYLSCQILSQMDLPDKHAGVGLARKLGMDEALRRFSSIDYNGLIVCLDADCTVKPNYLKKLESNFAHEGFVSGSINYEHVWSNEDELTKLGIVKYELGLRYYINALRFAGYPYAFHTIGSSMAVSAKTYARAGGMNKRKAGEDFYFLHKLIPLGGFKELNSTTVYPSSRVSERVPFGTGRAMLKWKEQNLDTQDNDLLTYNFKTFQDLKQFIRLLPALRNCREASKYNKEINGLPDSIRAFLSEQDFQTALIGCIKQTTSEDAFLKRIYAWLDGFKVLKFVHYSRDNFHPNIAVELGTNKLLQKLKLEFEQEPLLLLNILRKIDVSI